MKYIHVFNNTTDYEAYINGNNYVEPSFCFIQNDNKMKYHPELIRLCDIAYWDGSQVCTVPQTEWSSSLGTPVGVVVIPEGMLPDGKARMIALDYIDTNGQPLGSNKKMSWGPTGDTSLVNYSGVPITDNTGNTSTGSNSYGYLPSDDFAAAKSFVDPSAKYVSAINNLIPSPYLGDNSTFNPEYSKAISGYINLLSDFNGLSNTQTLVGLGTGYTAANACWKYKDGVSNTQWYLPAAGELGFCVARLRVINTAIQNIGGKNLIIQNNSNYYQTSTECDSTYVFYVSLNSGDVSIQAKTANSPLRPFAIL